MDYTKYHIPIFIITHNRYEILKQCVESYEKSINHPIRIIFFNTASNYQPTIDYMNEKVNTGSLIYNCNINNHKLVTLAIKDYLENNPQCKYYILTDPDIELDNVNDDILDFYIHLLNEKKVKSVGPMLRIDDIPDYYPRKQNAIDLHTIQFWNKPKNTTMYKAKLYEYIECNTDTTFQLSARDNIPADYPNNNSIRCFAPYSAKHLDWYLDPNNLPPCQKYYSDECSDVSHWANPRWFGEYQDDQLGTGYIRSLNIKSKTESCNFASNNSE
tara:strand:- start:114 stop:929 length:816 start_codon:yes stop_codon:yes gene_type:complete